MVPLVSRLVMIQKLVRKKVISKPKFYHFTTCSIILKIRDRTVIESCSLPKVDFLKRGETTDCLRT